MSNETIFFDYKFSFKDGEVKKFKLTLNKKTLALIAPERTTLLDWTRLEYNQCTNCPLSTEEHLQCPIALNMSEVIEFFKDVLSYKEVEVEIATRERVYKKDTTTQDALSSLLGIIMVTSGCPVLDQLRPMVRTHLPFATAEESTYRTIAAYLMAQFFKNKRDKKPDWDLTELSKAYEEIENVNRCYFKRLSSIHTEDAGLNALTRLNTYARFTNRVLLEEELGNLETLFVAYLDTKK